MSIQNICNLSLVSIGSNPAKKSRKRADVQKTTELLETNNFTTHNNLKLPSKEIAENHV